MDLILRLLEYAEDNETYEPIAAPRFDDCDTREIHYHLRLCQEAGYLRVKKHPWTGAPHANPKYTRYNIVELTWAGHEALEAMRAA
ncbi:MAG: DUF2513 domain-containing protein [Anaerolineaceae bacterium]|nr:DUF2513 domain-containing protein [Anaerolineaceae bacterium]